jgi:hypothetical protein
MQHLFLDQHVYKHLHEFLDIEEPTTLQTPKQSLSFANLIAAIVSAVSPD